jgi:hypothetical protein
MTDYTCTRHRRRDCRETVCRTERTRHAETRQTDPLTDPASLANPVSPVHQAVYGGPFYGSTDSDCGRSGSSYDSGSSSSSSYDSGSSSSSSCDSGGSGF